MDITGAHERTHLPHRRDDAPRVVLMTADTVGGVWTYALELIRALEPHGTQVALATMGKPVSRRQAEEARQIPNIEIFESRYKLEWMDDPWSDVEQASEWLTELEVRLRPDVIHLNGYVSTSFTAPTVVVGHSCVLSWWRAVKQTEAPPTWDRYRETVSKTLRSADMVVAPTRAMLGALEENYGRLSDMQVVPNGRDSKAFKPAKKEQIILSAGRLWDEAKNFDRLAQIAPSLPWKVYIAGDTSHPANGSDAARKFGNVYSLGMRSQSELADWMARSAIYVLPARYEPFGLSALEAALSGCALVLGDIPSLREVWDSAAIFVAPDDKLALRDAITSLIHDGDRCQEISTAALRRAHEFSPERMVSGYLDRYSELVEKRSREPRSAKEIRACV